MTIRNIELSATIIVATVSMNQPVSMDVVRDNIREIVKRDHKENGLEGSYSCWFSTTDELCSGKDYLYSVEFTQNDSERIEAIVIRKMYDVTEKEG